jgi:hypothetical protein
MIRLFLMPVKVEPPSHELMDSCISNHHGSASDDSFLAWSGSSESGSQDTSRIIHANYMTYCCPHSATELWPVSVSARGAGSGKLGLLDIRSFTHVVLVGLVLNETFSDPSGDGSPLGESLLKSAPITRNKTGGLNSAALDLVVSFVLSPSTRSNGPL